VNGQQVGTGPTNRDGEPGDRSVARVTRTENILATAASFLEQISYFAAHIAIRQNEYSIEGLTAPYGSEAMSASAAAKALRRFLVSLGHWAEIAATALDHGVPA
jgi:hypothetical protein